MASDPDAPRPQCGPWGRFDGDPRHGDRHATWRILVAMDSDHSTRPRIVRGVLRGILLVLVL